MPAKKTGKPPAKAKAKTSASKTQDFNREAAKQDAMAMFSSSLNHYARGADNKWRKTGNKA